jgi:hypothetical protein
MLTRLLMAVLLGAVMGCTTPTKVKVEHTVTSPDGVITETNAEFEGLPRHWANLFLDWEGILTLQGGEAIVVQPDYKGITEVIVPAVLCGIDPLTCKGD